MKIWPIEGNLKDSVMNALNHSPWFQYLGKEMIEKVVGLATLQVFEPDETIVRSGEASDSFFLLMAGEVSIEGERAMGDSVELGRACPPFSFGEVGLLLGKQRSATISAIDEVSVLSFRAQAFNKLFQEVSAFRINVARGLASRLENVSELVLPFYSREDGFPDHSVFAMLPINFMQRHHLISLNTINNVLTIGFVEDPTPPVLAGIRQHVPGMGIQPVRISASFFRDAINARLDLDETQTGFPNPMMIAATEASLIPPKLQALVERMTAEGASDLHLAAGRKPLWRIDGDMRVIEDSEILGQTEVLDLLKPIMDDRHLEEFQAHKDCDFGLSVEGFGRFRVNLYRTKMGINAALRQIPWKILSLEQLNLPTVLQRLCAQPKGLVLVTGPTGSGKSTTLAAMIDSINRVRSCHIITLENPIEFVHTDNEAMINQREVGAHAQSFKRGLKAALREDPDVVLLGEIGDADEASLALDMANMGHLVFAAMHANSAISAIEGIIEMFPAGSKSQARGSLANSLRGVVSQVLLKAKSGGRVAAIEILVGNVAVANLIREGKSAQLSSIMQAGGKEGHQLLNEHLARLVLERRILRDEAMTTTLNQQDLAMRLAKNSAQKHRSPS